MDEELERLKEKDYAMYLWCIEFLKTINWTRNRLIQLMEANWDFKNKFTKVEDFEGGWGQL